MHCWQVPTERPTPNLSEASIYVRSLRTMIPSEMQTGFKTVKDRKTGEETEVSIYDMTSQLNRWLPIALDNSMWNYHINNQVRN